GNNTLGGGSFVPVAVSTSSLVASDRFVFTSSGSKADQTLGLVASSQAPTIASIIPNTGSIVGGASVTITGTKFTGATAVSFGGTAATSFEIVNDTTITAITPASTVGAKSVLVTTLGGTNAANTLFTFTTPIIQISGNNSLIANADTTPSTGDHTDFGSAVLLNTQVTRTFTIANAGSATLQLTGQGIVAIEGGDAGDFTVTDQPEPSVPAGGSTTFDITFDPTLPGTRNATVRITTNDTYAASYTFGIRGFGALSTLKSQTITFTPLASVFLNQSPLSLAATASSGLPVTLTLVSGPATLVGNSLTLTGIGIVKITASQSGGSNFAAAPVVMKSIIVAAAPATLTLINLTQTYDGSPKPIATVGGISPVITYSVGGIFGAIVPVSAGSYPVKVVDGGTTKTGALVIARAVLTVTPNNQHKFAGQANSALTYSVSGLQGSDTPTVITKAPALTTTATLASAGGIYPITASGATALNYTCVYQPGSMVVESFAGSYEALLTDATSQLPVGKLSINVLTTGTTYTAKLFTGATTSAVSFAGTLATNSLAKTASGTATANILVNKVNIPYVITFTLPLTGDVIASATRSGVALGSASNGRKLLILATGKTVNYSGAHTAVLEPSTVIGNTTLAGPRGAGWATANISTAGVITLIGRLGDGTTFTTMLSPDDQAAPVYRLFVQPYLAARTESYLAGALAFALHPNPTSDPSLVNRRYVDATGLTWKKTGFPGDVTHRVGFGPVSTVLMLDPWLPPAAAKAAIGTTPAVTAISLANRLGLTGTSISFGVAHSPTGSTVNGNLPTRLNLSATNLVSVALLATAPVNSTKWKTLTFVPTTGTFTGTFELSDIVASKTVLRTVTFSGILRQPATAPDTLIGDGHYLLPSLSSTERTTGEIIFTRP
ncbi:MAG: choice-of-anchor D domain-containing protein, partial [Prosthecobacter sp.]